MINPFELRLRNWILRNNKPAQVWAIGQDSFQLIDEVGIGMHRNDGDCQPIPLTEGWLQRMGMQYSIWGFWGILDDTGYNSMGFSVFSHADGTFQAGMPDGEYSFGNNFQYVHQLQNLYFALTGEELTIKQMA